MNLEKKVFREDLMNTKEFKEYRKICEEMLKNDPYSVLTATENAKRMGFEQLSIDLKQEIHAKEFHKNKNAALAKPGFEFGRIKQAQLMAMRLGILPKMMRGLNAQYSELEQNDKINAATSDPEKIWTDLKSYAQDKWDIHRIGFTEVPVELVFKDHYIRYRYALVLIEEMKKKRQL